MTAAEKARELIDKFTKTIWESGNTVSKPMIKQCALIAVDEIMKQIYEVPPERPVTLLGLENHWKEVKTEIENF